MKFIDTHCHLDAPEFGSSGAAIRAEAACHQVVMCVLPAVAVANFEAVRTLAHAGGDSYALGIHPLYVKAAQDDDLDRLDAALQRYRDDPRLVAVGEIGLDLFVPELCLEPLRARQQHFYVTQLKLARKYGLPVLLHVRRSVDQVLKGLRAVSRDDWHGIAHAFNGSEQQAKSFIDLGFKLGFGGALTYDRALQLRRLAASLPMDALVLETDAPDMPPHWLYKTAQQRGAGEVQGVNSPTELPRICAELAALRGMEVAELAYQTSANACAALPGLVDLL
ncbi:TatD family hydrolase [Rhodoferax sp.]|uniref:TatD family hydrolase n=1 Tax=Rhodoferax sp. TaxID=50421 RepID=UPI002719F77F|nr:TatD family hydrolase [Rhodoferax sp.]MDO8317910.1 TatD family hydrolase [Rhodoferax sp.]MDP2681167.1 TatD family hydrolase [Rhodoferax sp.]